MPATITAQAVINRAKLILNDPTSVRWTEDEMILWLNEAQRVIAKETTDASNTVTAGYALLAGTMQNLPVDSFRLIKIYKEDDTEGSVLFSDVSVLDAMLPSWRAGATGKITDYFYDARDPLRFQVYPPQAGGETIRIVTHAYLPDVVISDPIGVPYHYEEALLNYILYRCFMKDDEESTGDSSRAGTFYNAFLVGIGRKEMLDPVVEPVARRTDQ